MVAFELFIWLIAIAVCTVKIQLIDAESQICGYNGDTLICCDGFKKDGQGECTIPICTNDCGVGGQCIRPDTCYCANGRVSNLCTDEGEHDMDRSGRKPSNPERCSTNCNGQGSCVNFNCKCNWGYSGVSCLEKPEDQCYLSLSRGICQNLKVIIKTNMETCCSAFNVAWGDPCQKCPLSRCSKGFIEMDGICHDIDECKIPGLCPNGQCENVKGTYKCICSVGFQFDSKQGDCEKIQDVCKQTPGVCGPGMKCVTLSLGGYSCQCLPGYIKTADQKLCVLKKENSFDFCAVYAKYVCQYGQCIPNGNNYKCECNAGYKASSDNKSCKKNIDYCAIYQNMLCPNGFCVSVNDDYMCKCDPGYSLSYNGKKCTSVCDVYGPSLCPDGRCIPQSGGEYECKCNPGYSASGKGKQCRRIMNDQSASSSNVAASNTDKGTFDIDYCSYDYYKKQCKGGQCINQKNYYQCECLNGYSSEENGLSCKKIETSNPDQMSDMAQTSELKNYCDKYGSYVCANGRCVESGSSYQCSCNTGYKESNDGKSCFDIDECAADPNVCTQGTCTNSPGSYQCSCYDGFTIHYLPGGPKCYDRNECEENQLLCVNGHCVNKWGSYHCSCNAGYVVAADRKQCIPARFPLESKESWHETECKDCVTSCRKIKSAYFRCQCPLGLAAVLNTGLCAPMTYIVDIQFDVPSTNQFREQKSSNKIKHIFFQLVPGANKSTVLAQMVPQFRSIVVNKCEPVNDSRRNGIVCFFYKTSV